MTELLTGIFSAFGLSASAGLNAYVPLLVIAIVSRLSGVFGWNVLNLQTPYNTLENGWIISLLIFLSLIEFFADKVPAVNHANDVIQTFIRPVAGAVAFAASAQVVTDIHPVISLAAGLLIAGTVHVAKAGALRPAVTATTGGAGNVFVSIAEDILATFLSILALLIPIFIGALTALFVAWLIWWLWRREMRKQEQTITPDHT
ncbi:MAG: DUF4126 domain-containing protein [Chloroflexi bacterium]|nr:DUF4126 domain-containing protein [Chloroflexota bacterium]